MLRVAEVESSQHCMSGVVHVAMAPPVARAHFTALRAIHVAADDQRGCAGPVARRLKRSPPSSLPTAAAEFCHCARADKDNIRCSDSSHLQQFNFSVCHKQSSARVKPCEISLLTSSRARSITSSSPGSLCVEGSLSIYQLAVLVFVSCATSRCWLHDMGTL